MSLSREKNDTQHPCNRQTRAWIPKLNAWNTLTTETYPHTYMLGMCLCIHVNRVFKFADFLFLLWCCGFLVVTFLDTAQIFGARMLFNAGFTIASSLTNRTSNTHTKQPNKEEKSLDKQNNEFFDKQNFYFHSRQYIQSRLLLNAKKKIHVVLYERRMFFNCIIKRLSERGVDLLFSIFSYPQPLYAEEYRDFFLCICGVFD